jgi:hypothetical protein
MYLSDSIQETLRELNKISKVEVAKKEGDIYLAVNVLSGESRILTSEQHLIESLLGNNAGIKKQILKG